MATLTVADGYDFKMHSVALGGPLTTQAGQSNSSTALYLTDGTANVDVTGTGLSLMGGVPVGTVTQVEFKSGATLLWTLAGSDLDFDASGSLLQFSVWLAGDDTLSGGDGNDALWGFGGNDTISGGRGHDTLDGYAGNDSLSGGQGNDVLLGRQGRDALDGEGGRDFLVGEAGHDTLLGAQDADVLWGGLDRDMLKGGTGDDELKGEEGNDRLNGGSGHDDFVFSTALATDNIDTVYDFTVGEDRLVLDVDIFDQLPVPPLGGDHLYARFFRADANGDALDGNDYILYETDTGKLFYDADGSGAGAKVEFALIGIASHPGLTGLDFQLM